VNELALALGWVGIYSPMAIGAMLETEGGYGRFVGLSAFPSSMVIYGIVMMFTLNREVTPENAGALFGIGFLQAWRFCTRPSGRVGPWPRPSTRSMRSRKFSDFRLPRLPSWRGSRYSRSSLRW